MTHDEIAIKLQVALLGEVFPSLRGVGFSFSSGKVRLVLYHDGALSEDDAESVARVETELMALLPRSVQVMTEALRRDVPTRMSDPEQWVFRRRE